MYAAQRLGHTTSTTRHSTYMVLPSLGTVHYDCLHVDASPLYGPDAEDGWTDAVDSQRGVSTSIT
jgi:hypothetical protein